MREWVSYLPPRVPSVLKREVFFAPQASQVPPIIDLPFLAVALTRSFVGVLLLHLTQHKSILNTYYKKRWK